MTQTTLCTLLFVINPISGGKPKHEYKTIIERFFEKKPLKTEFLTLTGKNDAEALQNNIEKLKPQIVIAVGGDGTVSLVAKKLLGTDIKLAILPAGSANGMARELNIPMNLEDALQIVEKGQVRKADAIRVNGEICFHLSDIGLNALLIKYFDKGKTRGKLGYAKVALKVLLRKQNIRVIIQTKDDEIKRDAFMVVLANASKYGTGAVINPKGDLYDGLFEVVIIRQLGLLTFLKIWFWPKSPDPSKIEVIQARSVHIETYRKIHFQVDGEYIGKVKHVNAEIIHGQLNILLPE